MDIDELQKLQHKTGTANCWNIARGLALGGRLGPFTNRMVMQKSCF